MARITADGALALLCGLILASVASGRTMGEVASARSLKGIEVAGAQDATPNKPKGLFDWLEALADEVGQQPVWGNCCGSGADCDEESSTIDDLDAACKRHDLCYGRVGEMDDYPESTAENLRGCYAICECDPDLVRDADELANTDCSEYEDPDYVAACEDMVAKAEPVSFAMKAKLKFCGC